MEFLKKLGDKVVNGALGLGIGAIQNKMEAKRMEQEYKYQKKLADYNHELKLRMFEQTGYQAQVEQLKKAGLSPSMLYGQGGGQGGTTGGNSADGMPAMNPMGVQMGLDAAMKQAQIDLIKSQKEKTDTENENLGGVERENKAADTALKNAMTLTEGMRASNYESQTKQIFQEIEIGTQKLRQELVKADISEETKLEMINKAFFEQQKIMYEGLNELTQGKLNEKQIKYVQEQIDWYSYNAITGRIKANAADKAAVAQGVSAEAQKSHSSSYKTYVESFASDITSKISAREKWLDQQDTKILQDWIFRSVSSITDVINCIMQFIPAMNKMKAAQKLSEAAEVATKGNSVPEGASTEPVSYDKYRELVERAKKGDKYAQRELYGD